jgi:hypothetical protein
MESKLFLRGCVVASMIMLFMACNSEQAAKTETTTQEAGMQQPSDTATLQKTDMKDSTAAKTEDQKEENEKDEKEEKDDD